MPGMTPSMMPIAQGPVQGPGLKRWDKIAATLAAQNIADWFNALSADELADYLVRNVDVAAMLPMVLTLPTVVFKVARYPLLIYLKNVLRGGPHKAVLYEEIRRMLADPRMFGQRYWDHCLLLAWGLYTDPEMRHRQLMRFPCLVNLSSAQPWYHANMDRVVKRLITQLEGGVEQHDTGRADRPDSTGSGYRAGGLGVPRLLPLQARGRDDALSVAVSDEFSGSAADLDQLGCNVVDFSGAEPD